MAALHPDIRPTPATSGGRVFPALYSFLSTHLPRDQGKRLDFFAVTLPGMLHLASRLPVLLDERAAESPDDRNSRRIPLLLPGQPAIVSVSRALAASLLCCAFFGITPTQRAPEMRRVAFPDFSFLGMFRKPTLEPKQLGKLQCFWHYFATVVSRPQFPPGQLVFVRQCLPEPIACLTPAESAASESASVAAALASEWVKLGSLSAGALQQHSVCREWLQWLTCPLPLCALTVESDAARIEDVEPPALEVDFANKFLGGGVLRGGCVQEEIRFAIAPELLLSCMVCAELGPRESLLMLGAERFSRHSGYASSFAFAGAYEHGGDRSNALHSQITAIDALEFSASGSDSLRTQFGAACALRELNKALVGFSAAPQLPRSTGWPHCPSSMRGGSESTASLDGASVTNVSASASSSSTAESHDDMITVAHGAVATGNWGAGAFHGHAPLKAILQWAAASAARRPALRYFAFGRADVAAPLHALASRVPPSCTVGALMCALANSCVAALRSAHGANRSEAMSASANTLLTSVGDILTQNAVSSSLHLPG
jgi:poly(ADP-ribose) glycohydrolase